MRERYLHNGTDAFAPHELVELLLFYGIPRRDTNPLAHRLMDTFGSVRNILNADRDVLLRVEGMTENAATLLSLVGDLRRYCEQEKRPRGTSIVDTEEQVSFLRSRFEDLAEEEVWLVSLDILSRVVGVHKISHGTPLSAEINTREVLRHVLADNAVRAIIAHNHPSGIALPSNRDITTTATMAITLAGAGVRLVDHLIFARDGDCVSFKQTDCIAGALRGELDTNAPYY
ncbi:MAG: RadC family protein [Clostridia bacterium]|nr:RadC family protein [Clostridia bacterium]